MQVSNTIAGNKVIILRHMGSRTKTTHGDTMWR